jgi:hypothetical protein
MSQHDPLSRVAEWLAPSADVIDKPPRTSPFDPVAEAQARMVERMAQARAQVARERQRRGVDDPVLALIAEEQRLAVLRIAASGRGDEIFDALPEDIRKGRVKVEFSDSELGQCISGIKNCFRSELELQSFLDKYGRGVWRRRAERNGESPEAAVAEFDREVGLDQALAQLRAGLEEIKTIREASGYEAHYREALALDERADVIFNQICETPPRTLDGAIAMLELPAAAHPEDSGLINTVIAGLRDIRPGPDVIGFGEPEEEGTE